MSSAIEWTDETWNPVRGCSLVSEGCRSCYAMKQAHRFSGPGKPYEGLTEIGPNGPRWTGRIRTVDEMLTAPLRWKQPRRIFVNSMSDLFHEDVPDEFIDHVFAVMALSPRHTFQILTKRAGRMRAYLAAGQFRDVKVASAAMLLFKAIRPFALPSEDVFDARRVARGEPWMIRRWPLTNVHLGVSVENRDALTRVDELKDTLAAVLFVSFEPLIEHLGALLLDGIQWAIVGGESGARPRHVEVAWIRSIVRQCRSQRVPVFVKQLGANVRDRNDAGWDGTTPTSWPDTDPDDIEEHVNGYREDYQGAPVRVHLRNRKGGDPSEWPDDLRVRQFPSLPLSGEGQ